MSIHPLTTRILSAANQKLSLVKTNLSLSNALRSHLSDAAYSELSLHVQNWGFPSGKATGFTLNVVHHAA